jgi:hypothetical protein
MVNKVKVDFWGNETTIYNWKEDSKNNNKMVSSMHESYKSEKISPSIYEKYALPTFKELEKNQGKEIDLNTFKIIRFGYLLLRMHSVPDNEQYEGMLEKILDKKRFESEEFEKIATEIKLANLVDHLNQNDRDDMKEFISNSDKITERNVKHSENITASKTLKDPYFINTFLSYLNAFMSFFDTEKTNLKQDIKLIRFFSNNEKEIEDKAISKAKRSGDIVDRPIKDVEITSSKEGGAFDDLLNSFFNSFLNLFAVSKDKDSQEINVQKQNNTLPEKEKVDHPLSLEGINFSFISNQKYDIVKTGEDTAANIPKPAEEVSININNSIKKHAEEVQDLDLKSVENKGQGSHIS